MHDDREFFAHVLEFFGLLLIVAMVILLCQIAAPTESRPFLSDPQEARHARQ